MRACTLAVLPVTALLLAGCGGSPHPKAASGALAAESSPSSSAAKLPGFLSIANNGAVFLQWQRQGSDVSGKRSESYYDPSSPTQLQAQADAFTGTITGSQVSLTFDNGDTWSGTISGSSMTLSYTGSDGSIQTLDFRPASAAQYNAAVEATKARVAGAVTRQQHQQAVSNARGQVETDASALADAVSSLQDDTSTLNGDSFSGDISTIQGDVQTVQGDLQTVQSDSSDVACSDAGVAANDADVAANDESVLRNDVQVDANDVQRVQSDIAAIRSAQQTLASDNAVVPNYVSPDVPAAIDVTAAIQRGKNAVVGEHQRVKGAEAMAAQLVAQARGIAAQAHAAGCG